MQLIDRIRSFALVILLSLVAKGQNTASCDLDYSDDIENCVYFIDEKYWTADFLLSLCREDGQTDKTITATVCEEDSTAEHERSLKLALLNTMYGKSAINPNSCGFYCMYDPLNLVGDEGIGFRWWGDCWRVLYGLNDQLCYVTSRAEWEWSVQKSLNWCPGRICEAYGDPHLYSFYANTMDMERVIGDYVLYSTDTLRIDVRLRVYINEANVKWNSVSGIHATAIEVMNGECDMKLEVYNRHQTASGDVMFLFNKEVVGWNDLQTKFSSCSEICSGEYEVDRAGEQFKVTFTDKVVVTIKKVENMHAVWILAPWDADSFTTGERYTEDQLCTEELRKLNCHNDTTILTNHDYDPEAGDFLDCEDVPIPELFSIVCDPNIERIAREACECENCPDINLIESCEYDVCNSPGVNDAWDENNEAEARAEAQVIGDEYCDWSAEIGQLNPSKCRDDATDRPTEAPIFYPSFSPSERPTFAPSQDPTSVPTESPTTMPSEAPTEDPTDRPTHQPTPIPTRQPTDLPSPIPTPAPSKTPSTQPTRKPTAVPTSRPTSPPTPRPTAYPTQGPSPFPTIKPTVPPTHSPTEYQNCAFLAHEHKKCFMDSEDDYITIDNFDAFGSAQSCAEICFRQNADYFLHATGATAICRCMVGPCLPPLENAVESVYRILPCLLQCEYIDSEEWWGQIPTSTELINGVIVPKPVKGLRFTSEIYAEIHMVGIAMELTTNNALTDSNLVMAPKLYLAGENRLLAAGEAEIPAFVDGYGGEFGNISKVFLTRRIYPLVPYTIAFEFLDGEAGVMVSTNTHYYNNGNIAQDVFGVKGTAGSEPVIVDTNAPNVVICYREFQCVDRRQFMGDDTTIANCPNGFGSNSLLLAYATDCAGYTFLAARILLAIANEFYPDCTSYCLFDTDWPILLNFMFNPIDLCWDTKIQTDGCEVDFPDFTEEVSERADLFCTDLTVETPVPTVAPTDHEKCNQQQINAGSHALLSIDSAVEILADICENIVNHTVLLDGGYVYGSSCTAEKTDEDKAYDFMYCAIAADYCDFKDLLISPNFEVDSNTTLVLVRLSYVLEYFWRDFHWGLEITMLRSLEINVAGLYLNSLVDREHIDFFIEDEAGLTIASGQTRRGTNSHARWYFAVLEDEFGNGVHLDYDSTYKLLFSFPTLIATSAAFFIETKIRVYTSVTMPFEVDDLFSVDNFLSGIRGTSWSWIRYSRPDYIPFIRAKFCQDLPTPAPTLIPTNIPTESPTEPCVYIYMDLLSYDENLYDFPSWFNIFGGEYKVVNETNGRNDYEHNLNNNFQLYWTGSEWKVHDTTGEYHFELTRNGNSNGYYPSLDITTVWQYENNQPGHDSLSGEVSLYFTCDKTFPPTVFPTTAEPTLEREPCANLTVVAETDMFSGNYLIVNDPSDYVFRNGKHQWYLEGDVTQGHILWMDDSSPIWENMWMINTPAGYLGAEDTRTSLRPDSADYYLYLNGEIHYTDDENVIILCGTEPPTYSPTEDPSDHPSTPPTRSPSSSPSEYPTGFPTRSPTFRPSRNPTDIPTRFPTSFPSSLPTRGPSEAPTKPPTFEPICDYFTLESDDFDEFDGEYVVLRDIYGDRDMRNGAPQWLNSKKGYIIFFLADGVFNNRWTIQAVKEKEPLVSTRDYYILSDEISWVVPEELNNPPRSDEWQVFSADTWHIIGDFLIEVDLECSPLPFPTVLPSSYPTLPPTFYYPCIYLNLTDAKGSSPSWIGVYTKITYPGYKNGKFHYSGPIGNELYWMEDGIFGQRWILTSTNGTVLAYEDTIESTNIPNKVLWQTIGFDSCVGHCVDFGNDVNITVTNLNFCPNTSVPTSGPSPIPTSVPTDLPTTLPTKSPTSSPLLMPSVIPTSSPSQSPTTEIPTVSPSQMPSPSPTAHPSTTTPEPTEHPTFAPTESPTLYPTRFCPCVSVHILKDDVVGLFTFENIRNTRFWWTDGETGWSLYWVQDGLFGGLWVIQGDGHEQYYTITGREGDVMPPLRNETWQKMTSSGYKGGSVQFVDVTLDCVLCEDTTVPTETPTSAPTSSPTLSPTCEENYISIIGRENKEYEGLYQRQEQNKNGKYYYVSDNGYTIHYVHDGSFDNHWVLHSSDLDYLYMIEQTWEGNEPVIGEESVWTEYRGSKFLVTGSEAVTLHCWDSLFPTNMPTPGSSPSPTALPTRSPSPPQTIYPTSMPSPKPSLVPSHAPSPKPSAVPSPSPTRLPTTSKPTSSPSAMPSASPTYHPTTLLPTVVSEKPTFMPTSSPTISPSDWCRCISSSSLNFNGIYMHNGRTSNQHWVWQAEMRVNEGVIEWVESRHVGWLISRIGGLYAAYEQDDPNWRNTPPLGTYNWTVSFETQETESITLMCTTCDPTPNPTQKPSSEPSLMPSPSPTALPTTPVPSSSPSSMPSPSPSDMPTTPVSSPPPSALPSPSPSAIPSVVPTPSPTNFPTTRLPTAAPSLMPSSSPSQIPSMNPTPSPTKLPSTSIPTPSPSLMPSPSPSLMPSALPSPAPSSFPSGLPTPSPSDLPTTRFPSRSPSLMPSPTPTKLPTTRLPTPSPSLVPSPSPSSMPSAIPSPNPTAMPVIPTLMPSTMPTSFPTIWCPCITVTSADDAAQVLGFIGTYEASGHVVNMHYHWRSHHGSEIYWGDKELYGSGDRWIIHDSSDNIAIFENVGRWTNTPPLTESSWGSYNFSIACDTCGPTPLPTQKPTDLPNTSIPSPSPSLLPSPSPSSMPSILPTPTPTTLPTTNQPSAAPSAMPSPSPTKLPTTSKPSSSPSALPSPSPSSMPSTMPTPSPSDFPTTSRPSEGPSQMPSPSPTALPTVTLPSQSPSLMPSPSPSSMPSTLPTKKPTHMPTTTDPSQSPSLMPTPSPTKLPTTSIPSSSPSQMPSPSPSSAPSSVPSPAPSQLPTTLEPTPLSAPPTVSPTSSPSGMPTTPIATGSPSMMPSPSPSSMPSAIPTPVPTKLPTTSEPSESPSVIPSPSPSAGPSAIPSPAPTKLPTTSIPTSKPSMMPSPSPTEFPTTQMPSESPSLFPSPAPSQTPSSMPTPVPTKVPTTESPSSSPSSMPSSSPSSKPSMIPTPAPSKLPTTSIPSRSPSMMPSPTPTKLPTTSLPSSSPSEMPSPSPSQSPSTMPTASPTKLPTTSDPSLAPSIMPSPSPTHMPTGYKPSPSPSLMPSPSPSLKPSTFPSQVPSKDPTIVPTRSPTSWGHAYCPCIQVTSAGAFRFNGIYSETGDSQNGLGRWRDDTDKRITWENNADFDGYWVIWDGAIPAAYPETREWPLTPPLTTETWQYWPDGLDSESANAMIALTCVPCPETAAPTDLPSSAPSLMPSSSPTMMPSSLPTPSPTNLPTTSIRSGSPSLMPSPSPSLSPIVPTVLPTSSPTTPPTKPQPSSSPSLMPSPTPTRLPTTPVPTQSPSSMPSRSPSQMPSSIPTTSPTQLPTTSIASASPSNMPSPAPTTLPTTPSPSLQPSLIPSSPPRSKPSTSPTLSPTKMPTTSRPSSAPSAIPSSSPTAKPSLMPTPAPSKLPTTATPTRELAQPTLLPTTSPSLMPSISPSPSPTDYPTSWCNCITVNSTDASGLSGTFIATGLVINQHYHWETSDSREIYWAEEGYWIITGELGVIAIYNDDSGDYLNIPPTETSVWDVFGYGNTEGREKWVQLSCDTCPPTAIPTQLPTKFPTTPLPTSSPSTMPSSAPSRMPSVVPSPSPTQLPTTFIPSTSPSFMPSSAPSQMPVVPTIMPTPSPTAAPTATLQTPSPSMMPSPSPISVPTTSIPSASPSLLPSPSPSSSPSSLPSPAPSLLPTTSIPSQSPSLMPSPSPTKLPTIPAPTTRPSSMPSQSPSRVPSVTPTPAPTKLPTTATPTQNPSLMPSPKPSQTPSNIPSPAPTKLPTTTTPSFSPSFMPSPSPSSMPSVNPSPSPTKNPTVTASPTMKPSSFPTTMPTRMPTWSPTSEIPCIHMSSIQYGAINGTYIQVTAEIGGKIAWENNNVELFFSMEGVFKNSWTVHNKLTNDYLILNTGHQYKGDSFPPLASTSSWQLFSNGAVAPSDSYVDLIIDYQTTCNPSQVPTEAPTETPTFGPTEIYLCVIATWNRTDPSFSAIPEDFYGAYYYNSLVLLTDNEFSKFPIFPSSSNGKPVFTKKRNENTISFFLDSDDHVNTSTWVIDSEDHTLQLVSSEANEGSNHPRFTDFQGSLAAAEYIWVLSEGGVGATDHVIRIEMSRELGVCESFDTANPTLLPTNFPTGSPSPSPSVMPTRMPSPMPSLVPTPSPSSAPSIMPSPSPTNRPTSLLPTQAPTPFPSQYPTLEYDCISVTSIDPAQNYYNGLYSIQGYRNGRRWFTDGNTGYDIYYVPAAVIIENAWVIEGAQQDYMSTHKVEVGTWTQFGQSDEVPPYGTFPWLQFSSPPVPSRFQEIYLSLEPVEYCDPTQAPSEVPTDFPTTSTPAPTTPSPTTVPTVTPSAPPSSPPSGTPTANPTDVCYVLFVDTPQEPEGTSVFEGTYVMQSVWKNGNAVWYNSNNDYYIYFVDDEWLPSSWIFQGDDGMDELVIFDNGTDGHPNTVDEFPSGERWILFYWGHNLQKREELVWVQIHCIPSFPPTNIPTPGPSGSPSIRPTSLPSPMPSANPTPSPSQMPSTIPTSTPSSMPSTQPSPTPTALPTYLSYSPTKIPSSSPTSSPTYVCPCIYVSSGSHTFGGMYQLSDSYNDRESWINYDTDARLFWTDYAADQEYWMIAGDQDFAVPEEKIDRHAYNPPIGDNMWELYPSMGRSGVSNLTLVCSTCRPTPSPTQSPTNIITPSPTTPSPTIMPTPSPSSMPSNIPTPSPSLSPLTPQPTLLSAEPSLSPTSSPSTLPTTHMPSHSPSIMPSPRPSTTPSTVPTPTPTASPLNPTAMPTQSPSAPPTTLIPTPSPSLMPSPLPSQNPSAVPTPSPTKVPTTSEPSSSPSAMPSPSPSSSPSAMPSPSPSPSPTSLPTVIPTAMPTDTCRCLVVSDPSAELQDYVGIYRHNDSYSPNTDKWMWERAGYNTHELIYYSKFGSAAARWVIRGSNYGEWAETSADESEPIPPVFGSWLINNDGGSFYQLLSINCSQCEQTPPPTPDPTESPTQRPTSLAPTLAPSPLPTVYCRVLNITDISNGFYSGYFEMDVLPYNGKHKWTNPTTGESLYWADTAMFEYEGPVENIWMLGFQEEAGDDDSHFLVFKTGYLSPYPHINSIGYWSEYTFNAITSTNSSIMINCEETLLPTKMPTDYPSEPLCTELKVHTCCDPVYTEFDGNYQAVAHRGGKDMFYDSKNGYSIYYTEENNGGYWSIRSEDPDLIWIENDGDNGAYPPWDSFWDLENHVLTDLEVMVKVDCSGTFSPSSIPTDMPTDGPTYDPTTLDPSPMPTAEPTFSPSHSPTAAPSESCVALYVGGEDGEITKFDGEYSRLSNIKNGKTEWFNYQTRGDVYWIDRGVYANTWIIRADDGDYLISDEQDSSTLHPPLRSGWAFLGDGRVHGEQYQNLKIICIPQPPAPTPTTLPTSAPSCEGESIHIEDPCQLEYNGYYNADYVHDDKNAYVRVDGKYEVIFIGEDIFAGKWMIRPHAGDHCNEFFLIDGYSASHIPPVDASWESYACGCYSADMTDECNFRITCMETKAPIPTEQPSSPPTPAPVDTVSPSDMPTSNPSSAPTESPTSNPTDIPTVAPTADPSTATPTQSPVSYECTNVELQPCTNITGRDVTFYEREDNQDQVTSNYYETKLYTEQKGYSFIASEDMIMYEAGMAFVNLASYQSITVRVFDDNDMLYESGYSYDGNGFTVTTGTPRGVYYTFRNMNVPLLSGGEYTVVFVVHCPATKTSRAEYPLCAPHHEVYSIGDFGSSIVNVYAYGEEYEIPTESDLYAPFVRICYTPGTL